MTNDSPNGAGAAASAAAALNNQATIDHPPTSRPQTGRIVVGVDGSSCSIDALRWAARQSALSGAALEAVMSWEYPTSSVMDLSAVDVDWAANAKSSMDFALAAAFGDDLPAIKGFIVRGRPAQVLITAAAGADLLVVGSRGHGAFAGFLLGSVSENVAAHAPCPVLIVRHPKAVNGKAKRDAGNAAATSSTLDDEPVASR